MQVWIMESGEGVDDSGVVSVFAGPFRAYTDTIAAAVMLNDAVIEAREDGLYAASKSSGAWVSLRPIEVQPDSTSGKSAEVMAVWLEETNAVINQYPDARELIIRLIGRGGIPLPS